MFSNVLSDLQKLLSPSFVVSVFFPVLAFWTANLAMVCWLNEPFRNFAISQFNEPKVGQLAVLLAISLIAVGIFGYMFSALLPKVQSLLEGRWVAPIASFFVSAQARKFENIRRQLVATINLRSELLRLTEGTTQWENWIVRLGRAREEGHKKNKNSYSKKHESYKKIKGLLRIWRKNGWISVNLLQDAVQSLENALEENEAAIPENGSRFLLDEAHTRLVEIIGDVVEFADMESTRLHNRIQFEFGDTTFSPTSMGNVANTVQSYGEKKYNFNVEVFWPRMQRALQRDKDFGPVIQNSKVQLDFLLACCALTGAWTLLWCSFFICVRRGLFPFYLTASFGTLATYAWYRIATAHYRTFAAVMRTSIDLFRLDLLRDLNLKVPINMNDERELWAQLHRIAALNEPINLTFERPKDVP
jgi:hypothetical protein